MHSYVTLEGAQGRQENASRHRYGASQHASSSNETDLNVAVLGVELSTDSVAVAL